MIRFKRFHHTANIKSPLLITPKCIEVGKNVYVEKNGRIEGVFKYNSKQFKPRIIFEQNVSIAQNLHLTCANLVKIGRDTYISANVTITDIHHPYENITIPKEQDITVKQTIIGDECKILNNAVILPGVTIGKHCTIGANSVVTHDIPDYCVAVGAPARVIKKYNFESQKWEKI